MFQVNPCLCPLHAARKNRPTGSKLVRSCWCAESKARFSVLPQSMFIVKIEFCDQLTCPRHVLGELCQNQKEALPFRSITAANALKVLRVMLGLVGVTDPEKYRTHDLRRGHAKDLQLAGKP